MGVVWIASYPKSGNTWVRFLLANYLIGPVEDSAQVERLIPYADQVVSAPQRRYIKTHRMFEGSLGRELTERSVYVVRHPKDVLLSNLNYKHLVMGRQFGYTPAQYAREFITLGGDRQWMERGFGTLESHVRSWMGPHAFPTLVVRYEDLKLDAAGELSRVLKFLGIEPEPERVEQAAAGSSFERMRAMEVRERTGRKAVTSFAGGAMVGAARAPKFFMNEGRVRRSLAHIDPAMDAAFDRRFAGLMRELGYDVEE